MISSFRFALTTCCILYVNILFSQPQTWYFGQYAGLKFTGGSIPSATAFPPAINTFEGCSVANDKNGNALFYTDGTTIWYANGNVVIDPITYRKYILKGNSSSTQSAMIITKPNTCDTFFIFTTAQQNAIDKDLCVSMIIIDPVSRNLRIPNGELNRVLKSFTSEKLAAINNGNSFWIVGHDAYQSSGQGQFWSFKIDDNTSSVNSITSPVISLVGQPHYSALGQMKISSNGNYIAVITTSVGGYFVECFKFNLSTGTVSSFPNGLNNTFNSTCRGLTYGLEFSPNEHYIYASSASSDCGNKIFRFNLLAPQSVASPPALIFSQPGTGACGTYYGLLGMQLGPNGVIYIANEFCDHLAAITDPNNPNITSVGFTQHAPGTALPAGSTCILTLPTIVTPINNSSLLDNGLVAYWPFNGGSLADEVSGYLLQNSTGATPTDDRNNSPNCAFKFSRANSDYLTFNQPSFLDFMTTTPFSISLWYKATGSVPNGAYECLVSRDQGLSGNGRYGQWSVGLYDLRFASFAFNSFTKYEPTSPAPMTNVWNHLVVTHNNGVYKLFKNTVASPQALQGPYLSNSQNIGNLFIGKDLEGAIDDIRIYNRELNQTEVTSLYNLGSSCDNCSNLIIQDQLINPTETGSIQIIPNPASSHVHIYLNNLNTGGQLNISNSSGQVVLTTTITQAFQFINMTAFPSGMYVAVYSVGGHNYSITFIK